MGLFKHDPQNSIQVLSEDALKKRVANDKYLNDKKVSDAVHSVLRLSIYGLAVLGIFAIGYIIYYYLFSPAKDPSVLLDLAKGILIYIVGFVTPTIHKVLGFKKDEE